MPSSEISHCEIVPMYPTNCKVSLFAPIQTVSLELIVPAFEVPVTTIESLVEYAAVQGLLVTKALK